MTEFILNLLQVFSKICRQKARFSLRLSRLIFSISKKQIISEKSSTRTKFNPKNMEQMTKIYLLCHKN